MNYLPFLSEYLGTFFFILSIFASQGNPLIIGGALALVIYLIGGTSGGHVNPAGSFAMFLNQKLDASRFVGYVVAQLLGAGSAFYAYQIASRS